MAWTLCEWVAQTAVTWMIVLFLKRVKETVVTEVCMIPRCQRPAAISKRGLCLICYSKAKAKVESRETTWDKMVKMRLCKDDSDPFDDAYTKAMEDE